MKRIGEGVAKKLDYTPRVSMGERQMRGKWVAGDRVELSASDFDGLLRGSVGIDPAATRHAQIGTPAAAPQ